MKKSLYIYAIVALMLTFSSCKNEQEDIWEDSSAIRMEKTVQAYADVLTGAQYGWSVEYFSGIGYGYNFVFKFNQDGSVMIAGKNSDSTGGVYKEETSLWEMIKDNGPVLTLNTYNSVFHYFSDPDPSHSEASDGYGYAGDYEFMVLSACADSVLLQGKKSGLEIRLYPLESENPQDYFTHIEDLKASLFNANIPYLWLDASGERYSAQFDLSTNEIAFVPENGDAISETQYASFLMTRNGIRFFSPFEGKNDNFSVQEFVYDEATAMLVSIDGTVTLSAGPLADLFLNTKVAWRTNKDSFGGQFATLYDDVVAGCKAKYKKNFSYFEFTYNASEESYVLGFKNGTYSGYFLSQFTITDDSAKFAVTSDGNKNAENHYKNVPAFGAFIDAINATEFAIEAPSAICPSPLKLVSKSNPADYIIVSVQ